MYSITFSINIEVLVKLFMHLIFSILLKLEFTIVKDVFRDVNCVKC